MIPLVATIDMETLSTEHNAALLSIGAVIHDFGTGQQVDTFYANITPESSIAAGLDVVFGEDSILLAGEEVGDAIRQEEISSGASQVAALPAVRAALLFRQRAFRQAPGLVADGRDMASVVFPDAQTKVFLTASVEIRAERRYKQLIEKGIAASIQPLLLDLRERDARDSQRSVAPLKQNEDAELLDTTNLTIDQAVAQVLSWHSKQAVSMQ